MKSPKVLSKIIVKHSENCFAKNSQHEWSGITDGYFYGNFRANENRKSSDHIWHRVICNDPNCQAIKAVHSSVLENA